MKTTLLGCLLIFLFTCSVQASQNQSKSSQSVSEFNALVDKYFDFYFSFHPSEATAAGFHQYDQKLENYSSSAQEQQARGLKDFLRQFQAIDASKLPADTAADREWIMSEIHALLLEIESVQMWRKDPDHYTSGVTNSVFMIMKRNYAPAEDRLRSAIAREKQIPQALEYARQNLTVPPKIYTEIALEQLPGDTDFFRSDVPAAFASVTDPKLLSDFKASNQAVIDAFEGYQKFLKDSVLPHANGNFRLGAENYRKKLLYEEMVDIPLDRLLKIGYDDLHRNQEALKKVAAEIDPNRSTQEVVADLQNHHPAPDQLLQAFRDTFSGLTRFIEDKKIVTIPAGDPPVLEDTPPFERATTEASMDTPGPYETKGRKAFFNVTTPDPKWPPQRIEEWMKTFNNSMIPGTAIHEVYPGHFVQFLWIDQVPSKIRKLIYSGTNAEGWAHYCEQMMLDEGYGNGDPKLRLGQLNDALLRNARYIVGIQMHTGNMTLDEAREFFVKEGFQTPAVAEVETKRGTSDPTYLMYTLGKLQILKLRDDYRKMRGKDFSLLEFHDRFMQQGGVPLKIIRKAMLGNDSPTL
ncbi:MAG TPA: DUF885 domain-containing protein [Terriglobales bacterium]|nr:DUF885 domain-containing protein [Terriglobales bacterium]